MHHTVRDKRYLAYTHDHLNTPAKKEEIESEAKIYRERILNHPNTLALDHLMARRNSVQRKTSLD